MRTWTGWITIALLPCGCTSLSEYIHNGFKVGPNYARPPAPVAQRWIDANDVRLRSESGDLSHWWTVFDDPVLSNLIQAAYQQNLTLREAGFRVLQARANLGIAVGELFPQTQVADGGFTQTGVSLEVANRGATPQRFFSQWDLGLGIGGVGGLNTFWELDFWGRFRRAIEAADDQLNASVENYDDVLVTLLGDVAANYVALRTLEQQLAYVRTNVELQKETLQIAQARFKGGQSTELDVDQAESTLYQTEAQIPQVEIQIRQTTNRLCILLGIPPEELRTRLGPAGIPKAPADVIVGIPAELLQRRPDVRRAERKAAAQCAEIGVAESDFYPLIGIKGQVGYSAQHFSTLFSSQAFGGFVGPEFTWNVLNYGRILNNVRLQEAGFQELVAKYQNTVLRANEEVENGLIQFLKAQQRTTSLTASVDTAQKAVKIAVVQYKGGLVDFNRVSLLEQNLVQQQNLLAESRGEIALGLIQVYRALGGGWQIRNEGAAPLPADLLGDVPDKSGQIPQEAVPLPRPMEAGKQSPMP